ncbi:MAG: hypothetical protein RLP44_29425 [Aggregatilineales bacterium]
MTQLAAAENLMIDMQPALWRLLSRNELGEETIMVEIEPGSPLRYTPEFARTRRLPTNGSIPAELIRQVVLGWSQEDEAWHLGLLLMADLAAARGSRWCEIASWPDPDRNVFLDHAQRAGQSLSEALNRSFGYIAPKVKPVEVAPPPPLPDLPITAGLWRVDHNDNGDLTFERSRRWLVGRMTRMAWYTLLVVAYLVLSLTTINTDLALPNAGTMLPNPELLPYLGLVIAGLLVLAILYIIYEILTKPNRIVIDPTNRTVSAMHGNQVRWSHVAEDIHSIYVTQEVNKRGKKRTIYHGEINLHRGGGRFRRILENNDEHELPDAPDLVDEDGNKVNAVEGITPLNGHNVYSDLQVVALYVSESLGNLACWYDQRIR